MFTKIEGLPPDVLAIEAIGEITHEDYQRTLIPTVEAMAAKGPVNMLFVVGSKYKGFDSRALWDDTTFGMKYWSNLNNIAVVTDLTWLRRDQDVQAVLPWGGSPVSGRELVNR